MAVSGCPKAAGGRPRKPDALVAVTLSLHPDVIAAFQAGGNDWRARMAELLRMASQPHLATGNLPLGNPVDLLRVNPSGDCRNRDPGFEFVSQS